MVCLLVPSWLKDDPGQQKGRPRFRRTAISLKRALSAAAVPRWDATSWHTLRDACRNDSALMKS